MKQGPATATQPPAAGPGPQDNYTENKNINFTHWDQSETERFLKLFNGGPIKLRVGGQAITRESWYDALQFLVTLGTNEEVFIIRRAVRSREGPEALEKLGVDATVVELGPEHYFIFPPTEDLGKLATALQGDVVDSVPVPGFRGAHVIRWGEIGVVLQRNTTKEGSVVLQTPPSGERGVVLQTPSQTQTLRESEIDRGFVLQRMTSYTILNNEGRKSVSKTRGFIVSFRLSLRELDMLDYLADMRGATASQVLREALALYHSLLTSVATEEASARAGPVVLNNPVINITLPPQERDRGEAEELDSDREASLKLLQDRVRQLEEQVRNYRKTIEGYRRERGELTDRLKKCAEAFSKVRLQVDFAKKFIEENNLDKAKQLLDEARSLIDEIRGAISPPEQA